MAENFRLRKALEFMRLQETRQKQDVGLAARRVEQLAAVAAEQASRWAQNLEAGAAGDSFWGQHAAKRSTTLGQRVREGLRALDEARADLAAKRQALAALAMKREALENLERKHAQAVRQTESRRVQSQIDEGFRLQSVNRKPAREE